MALNIDNVRFGVHSEKTRMVIDMSQSSEFRTFVLSDPWRLVIDLPQFDWNAGNMSQPADSGVKSIRQGLLKPGISRMVIDLDTPTKIRSAFLLPKTEQSSNRLVIDFSKTDIAGYVEQKGKIFGKLNIDNAPSSSETAPSQVTEKRAALKGLNVPTQKPAPRKKPVIIIDAGHGGVDPGAIGSNGLFEKHVTLSIAKELKKQLEATGRYKVRLTRERDQYLKLYKRVDYARKYAGDLFISIHADSIERSSVRGASVYTLSEKASDKQTAQLAMRENRADLIAGVDLSHEDEDVAGILVDLAMRDTMNQSNFFANTLVGNMQGSGLKLLENPHRSAGFAVLKAPDIPSVLIEVGFMSNRREAEMLSKSSYRKKIAASIIRGIDIYFSKLDHNHGQ